MPRRRVLSLSWRERANRKEKSQRWGRASAADYCSCLPLQPWCPQCELKTGQGSARRCQGTEALLVQHVISCLSPWEADRGGEAHTAALPHSPFLTDRIP